MSNALILAILGVVFLLALLSEVGRNTHRGSGSRVKSRYSRSADVLYSIRTTESGKFNSRNKRHYGSIAAFRNRTRNRRHSRRRSGKDAEKFS